MDNESNDANIKFKAFLIVLSIFIGFYYIVLLICLALGMKHAKVFIIWSTIGIAVSMALAGIIYGIRANDPENNLTFQKAVEKTILVGIYFGISCGLLYILAKDYGYNLELLILSAILLAGILASIGTSIPWQSLISIGIVLIYPLFKLLIKVIELSIEKWRKKREGYQEIKNKIELETIEPVQEEKLKTN
jgi:hypothetical protein